MIEGLHNIDSIARNRAAASEFSLSGVDRMQTGGNPFGDLLIDTIGGASRLEDQARVAIDGFMTGKGVDVHQVMIATEKASMAFEMALAVRNKAVQSYQSVMSMQF